MANIVIIEGQFNVNGVYFAGSPVVIKVSGLEWPTNPSSPFTVVKVGVTYGGKEVGSFHTDTGGDTEIVFDIQSALRTIWADYDFSQEAASANSSGSIIRGYRGYTFDIYTEYLSEDGVFTQTHQGPIPGGACCIGKLTEWERRKASTDVSGLLLTNLRFGDASTKPTSSPERVGENSCTSWVGLGANGTVSHFYASGATMENDSETEHAPMVLRDSQPYVDFLFLNRRGAVETCSGLTKEAMEITADATQYALVGRPSFAPARSLMAIGSENRRSWQMSSGPVAREWAEWWTMEFLGGAEKKLWWMKYPLHDPAAAYVPVTVTPAKKNVTIYDKNKQQMPHVDFTVTLGLEG